MRRRRNRRWRGALTRWRERPQQRLATKTGDEQAPEMAPETWLSQLYASLEQQQRIDEVAGDDFWRHVETMGRQGDERVAAQWITKFLLCPATPPHKRVELRVNLMELFYSLGNLDPALPHLHELSKDPDWAIRAHFLLAEHHRKIGDHRHAIQHYEAVVARDVDYPNARSRLEALRANAGHASVSASATLTGPANAFGSNESRYALLRELGRGSSGVVYLAQDRELKRQVAVKLLHPHLAATSRVSECARFFDEARIAASLRHPNIVAILDVDEKARRIVMEWAAGGTLRNLISERGSRSPLTALQYHAQLLSALAAAHAHGVVHRDVKPANLMFRRDPHERSTEIILGDFGVAHLPDARTAGRDDREGHERRDAVGTLAYMPPEQRLGVLEPRSDLYAAAVVLYQMLVAKLPWDREATLRGERRAEDFTLPNSVEIAHPVLKPLNHHLRSLGHPSPELRPDSREALHQASVLLDTATRLLAE